MTGLAWSPDPQRSWTPCDCTSLMVKLISKLNGSSPHWLVIVQVSLESETLEWLCYHCTSLVGWKGFSSSAPFLVNRHASQETRVVMAEVQGSLLLDELSQQLSQVQGRARRLVYNQHGKLPQLYSIGKGCVFSYLLLPNKLPQI